jgi:hypothetical protein
VALAQPMPPVELRASTASPLVAETTTDTLAFTCNGSPDYCCWYQGQDCCLGGRFWLGADYLLWWVKDSPMPVPLVTTGPLPDPRPAVLGQPNTRVFFGGADIDHGTFAGMRVGAGLWLDEGSGLGIEASGFCLEKRSDFFTALSGPDGCPVISIPAFNPLGVRPSN